MTATGVIEAQRVFNRLNRARLEHIREIVMGIIGSADFESATPLRQGDDEGDSLGADYDPDAPGIAEAWFRQLRGDE
jgi:hypothetical protein